METICGKPLMRCVVCGHERERIRLDGGRFVRDHRGRFVVPDHELSLEIRRLIEIYGSECNSFCTNECSAEIAQIVKKLRNLDGCYHGLEFLITTLPESDYKILADTSAWGQFKSLPRTMASIIRE